MTSQRQSQTSAVSPAVSGKPNSVTSQISRVSSRGAGSRQSHQSYGSHRSSNSAAQDTEDEDEEDIDLESGSAYSSDEESVESDSADKKKGLSVGGIVGIAVAGVVVLATGGYGLHRVLQNVAQERALKAPRKNLDKIQNMQPTRIPTVAEPTQVLDIAAEQAAAEEEQAAEAAAKYAAEQEEAAEREAARQRIQVKGDDRINAMWQNRQGRVKGTTDDGKLRVTLSATATSQAVDAVLSQEDMFFFY